MRDYIFSRLLSKAKTDDDASDVLFGGKDSILPPKEEEKKEEQDIKNKDIKIESARRRSVELTGAARSFLYGFRSQSRRI